MANSSHSPALFSVPDSGGPPRRGLLSWRSRLRPLPLRPPRSAPRPRMSAGRPRMVDSTLGQSSSTAM
eukprot:12461326-Alexandrium_andersonii.AAC.1